MKREEVIDLYARWDATEAMQSFYKNLYGYKAKRRTSQRVYRIAMFGFFRWKGTDPDSWLASAKAGPKAAQRDFEAYLDYLDKRPDISENAFSTYRASLLKFARAFEMDVRLREVEKPALKRDISPLTPEEIKRLIALPNVKGRAIILLAATSGMRVSEIAGLTEADLHEIFERNQEPYAVHVRDETAKGGHGYWTFFTEECAEALRAHIQAWRISMRTRKRKSDRVFLERSALEKIFKRLVAKAGLEGDRTFHSLRKFCRTQLEYGIRKEAIVEKIIGHNYGSLQQIYTAPSIEQLRSDYAQALPNLTFSETNGSTRAKVSGLEEDVERLKAENEDLREEMRSIMDRFNRIAVEARVRRFRRGEATAADLEFAREELDELIRERLKAKKGKAGR